MNVNRHIREIFSFLLPVSLIIIYSSNACSPIITCAFRQYLSWPEAAWERREGISLTSITTGPAVKLHDFFCTLIQGHMRIKAEIAVKEI